MDKDLYNFKKEVTMAIEKIFNKYIAKNNKKKGFINCCNCGKEHKESTKNCCWKNCKCGIEICGRCGSVDIRDGIEDGRFDENDESGYWCNKYCKDCGLEGCGMCI
jgi:hypothetical protein